MDKCAQGCKEGSESRKECLVSEEGHEAEGGRNGGKIVWRCIRDIQHGQRGLIPVRTAAVRYENGNLCDTPDKQQQRWRRHFGQILNLQSEFDVEELSKVRQRQVRTDMAEPLSEKDCGI